jgi:RNA polymerase sigma-70 factor, ECF subfamily
MTSVASAGLDEALRRGDRACAIQLIDELFGAALFRFIHALVRRDDLADDLYQKTLFEAFRDLATFAERSSLRTWLFGIARQRCLDALKAEHRRDARFAASDELPQAVDVEPSPELRLIDAELQARLNRCLAKLAPELQMVLLMRFAEGFGYDDIARVCRAKEEAMRARVSRAMPVLRSCIEGAARAAGPARTVHSVRNDATYLRIARAIREVSAGVERRPDHVARAIAAGVAVTPIGAAPRSSRNWARRAARIAGPVLALAAAAALVWWLRRDREPAPPRFAMEIVAHGRPVLRGDAQLGERLRVTARAGAAIWIYRNDHELVLVCPRDCRRDGEQLVGELVLDAIGRYQVVWLSTEQLPLPSGDLERDVAAARAAGATHDLRDLEVR